jgi:hypothetical protein
MYGYLLQDWITIRSSTTGASPPAIIQSEVDWISLQPYQDVVFWLDVKSVALGGLTSMTLDYETAPAKDEGLFTKMITTTALTAAVSRQDKVLLAQNPTVPLARWVRWKLSFTGTASSEYGACFRIYCAANAVGTVSG